MLFVVAWFCECGSSVRMSFCAAQRRVSADTAPASPKSRLVNRANFNTNCLTDTEFMKAPKRPRPALPMKGSSLIGLRKFDKRKYAEVNPP